MNILYFLIRQKTILKPLPKAPESPRVSVLDEIIRDHDWYKPRDVKKERKEKPS